jgi:hypothetical protein
MRRSTPVIFATKAAMHAAGRPGVHGHDGGLVAFVANVTSSAPSTTVNVSVKST